MSTPENLVVFQWRSTDGGWTARRLLGRQTSTGTVTVKLVRVGNEFSGYYSTDGSHVDAGRHDPDDRHGRDDPGGPCGQLLERKDALHRDIQRT